MTKDRLSAARHRFARELRYTADVRSAAVIEAFASVPRERFLGPGPWRLLSPMNLGTYRATDDADPQHLYHDVLVAIDEVRRLNNGQPSLWAYLFDRLGLSAGAHVLHVGAGTGYYSAILAEIVGREGRVTAIEIDPILAERTRLSLAMHWPQATVISGDGFTFRPEQPADAIVVSAGASHPSPAWLDALVNDGGRLLVPLTTREGRGGFLLVRRQGEAMRPHWARFLIPTRIFPCVGGHDPTAEARLKRALGKSSLAAVRSLRRDLEALDETCWLAGEGWWLSMTPIPGDEASEIIVTSSIAMNSRSDLK